MSVRIIRWRPEHEAAIRDLYPTVFGERMLERSLARWRWQYLDNPNTADDGPVIWLAEEDDRILGQMATMPFPFWWGGREVRASAGMDYFVRPDAQGRGLGIALSEAWADHVDVALALGLTPSSYPLFKKIFTDVGPVPAYLKVLDAGAVARRRLGKVAGAVAGPALGLGLQVFSRRVPRAAGVDVRAVTQVTDEYDAFWLRGRASFATAVRRDAKYLKWKYLACPFRQYQVLEARRHGELAGYAVVRAEGDASFPRGFIADLFAEAGDAAAQDALIDAAVGWCRERRDVRAETYVMHRGLGRRLVHHGFRPGRTGVQYCIAYRHAPADPLADVSGWHLVLGDGDLDRA